MDGQQKASGLESTGRHLARGGYALAVLASASFLFGSIGLQVFGSPGAHDGSRAHRHQVYCAGELWHLRRLLQEAAAQSYAPATPRRARAARDAHWNARLAEVRARCRDLPTHAQLAGELAALAERYAEVDAQLAALADGPAAELASGLAVLP